MSCNHLFAPNKMGGDAEIVCRRCGILMPTPVERDYEEGKWVPSYYGNKFTVAQKKKPRGGFFVDIEQDLSFKVATLAEAQAEADKRNQ